jgi:hypothetical protein
MLQYNATDYSIDIEDLGVTLRTLLAVGAAGCKSTGRRKWDIRYKSAIIARIQVSSARLPARISLKARMHGPRPEQAQHPKGE